MQKQLINKRLPALFVLLAFSVLSAANAGGVSTHENAETGLITWTVEEQGFSMELIQLIPDFIRAIYAKHNFPADEIERIASYCMFGTILKNTSEQIMHYRVKDWRYRTRDGTEHPVKTKSEWLDEWKKTGINFSWTLLPEAGDFEVGDWQQGFTSIELTGDMTRDSRFDLIYKWRLGDKEYHGIIQDMKCAPRALSLKEIE